MNLIITTIKPLLVFLLFKFPSISLSIARSQHFPIHIFVNFISGTGVGKCSCVIYLIMRTVDIKENRFISFPFPYFIAAFVWMCNRCVHHLCSEQFLCGEQEGQSENESYNKRYIVSETKSTIFSLKKGTWNRKKKRKVKERERARASVLINCISFHTYDSLLQLFHCVVHVHEKALELATRLKSILCVYSLLKTNMSHKRTHFRNDNCGR